MGVLGVRVGLVFDWWVGLRFGDGLWICCFYNTSLWWVWGWVLGGCLGFGLVVVVWGLLCLGCCVWWLFVV